MPRGLLTLLTLAATATTARAGIVGSSLDPQLAKPYDWRVVVRFAPGPLSPPASAPNSCATPAPPSSRRSANSARSP